MKILLAPGTTGVSKEVIRSLITIKSVVLHGCGYDPFLGKKLGLNFYHYVDEVINGKRLVEELESLQQRENYDAIYICHDEWLRVFANSEISVSLSRSIVNLPTHRTKLLLSKRETYNELAGKLPLPIVYESINEVERYPLFLKPDIGQGSRGAGKIGSFEDANEYLDPGKMIFRKSFIVSEFLEGPEYTIDCFSDPKYQLIYFQSREREKIATGISVQTSNVFLDQAESMARMLSSHFEISGAWFFQLKSDNHGQLKLLEVGIRIGGASGLNRCLGVNLSHLQLYQHLGESISVIKQEYPITYFQSQNRARIKFRPSAAYFDYDDTIFGERGFNTSIVDTIKYFHSIGIRVAIITRSKRPIETSLNLATISNLISNIYYLRNKESKSKVIQADEKLVFVDDSYRERLDVHRVFAKNALVIDPAACETKLEFSL